MSSNEIKSATSSTREPWVVYLDDDIEESGEDDLSNIMKRLLLSTSENAAADAAREVDEYYSQTFLPSDPLMKFSDDKGMGAYLWGLYQLIFDMGKLVPYKDATKQERLTQLLVELRKLPPRTFKIWDAESEVYTREPIFGAVMDECWNANGPTISEHGPEDSDTFKEACEEWVNFSAFTARCIQADLLARFEGRGSKYPSWDIPDGLEEGLQPGNLRDCRVMVSAQYVLLAGRFLHENHVKKPAQSSKKVDWWQEKWQLWQKKFEELSEGYEKDGKTEMAVMTREARDLMLSLSKEPSA